MKQCISSSHYDLTFHVLSYLMECIFVTSLASDMPRYRYCGAPGCTNAVIPNSSTCYKGTMHSFPNKTRHLKRFQEWIRFCEREPDWKPPQTYFFCDTHFVSDKIVFLVDQVPTISADMTRTKSSVIYETSTSLLLDITLDLF